MRVLHVIPSLAARTGGPAVTAVETARVVSARGVESVVFSTNLGYPAQAWNPTAVAPSDLVPGSSEVDVRLFPTQRPHRLAYSPALRRSLRKEVSRYDVVHIHSLYLYPQFAAFTEAARCNVPYVVCLHGALDPWLRHRGRVRKSLAELFWQRRMLARAAALHFTVEEEARLAADVAPAVPRVIVPNGVRWADFARLPSDVDFRTRLLKGHRGPVVLFLGRLAQKKGLDVLIQAFALCARRFPEAMLVIAGPDDEGLRPRLVSVAEREGVAEQVVFTGLLLGEEKLGAMSAAAVWVLSSHTEAFTIAVIEALAAGLPTVISTAVNLAPEIDSARAGIVCDISPQSFADAIGSLLRDEKRRLDLGKRAREFARGYDWSALAPQILGMYEEVVGRHILERDGETSTVP
jgi:glycosyltransferase involved in cell wall biosynthesis